MEIFKEKGLHERWGMEGICEKGGRYQWNVWTLLNHPLVSAAKKEKRQPEPEVGGISSTSTSEKGK